MRIKPLSLSHAEAVAARFFKTAQIVALREVDREGFSEAALWRVETSVGPFCLKAWPCSTMPGTRLQLIHQLLRRRPAAQLRFIPPLQPTLEGQTYVEWQQRTWDMVAWLPGLADFERRPSVPRMNSAVVALAELHAAWQPSVHSNAPCPAVLRRLQAAAEWQSLLVQGWTPDWRRLTAQVGEALQPAWPLLQRPIPRLVELQAWAERAVALQPCHCDPWHDNLLFMGEELTGIIDFGSVKLDHIAADLARMLGSLAADSTALYHVGLEAYRRCRPLDWEEEGLIRVLDETGVWVSLTNWMRWLALEGRVYRRWEHVIQRVLKLRKRAENLMG